MKYYLKNKDKLVLEFNVADIETKVFNTKINEKAISDVIIFNDNLPKGIRQIDLCLSLKSWIEKRKIPENRRFVEKIVASYGGSENNFMDYIDVSLALSLNDTFWITPVGGDYKWSD